MGVDDTAHRPDRGVAIGHLAGGLACAIVLHTHIVHVLALVIFVVRVALAAVRGDAERRPVRYLILAGLACAATLTVAFLPHHLVAPSEAPSPWLWWIISATSLVIAAVERRRDSLPGSPDPQGSPVEHHIPGPHG